MDTVFRPLQTRQSSTPPGTFTLDSEPPSPRPVCSHLRALCVKGSSAPTPSIRCQLSTVDCQPSSLGHLLLNRPFDLTQKSLDNLYTYMIFYVMLARQITLPRPFPTKLTALFRYSCRLFVVLKKVNPFGIRQIQALFAKYRGWGIPNAATGHPGWGVPPAACLGVSCLAPPRSITLFRINTYEKHRGEGATSGLICSFLGSGANAQARVEDWYRMRALLGRTTNQPHPDFLANCRGGATP
jgi:hypothetical protein